jgi:ABC-2 type transport system permease protein
MQAFLTLTRRELATFLISIAGYAIIALSAFLIGMSFTILIKAAQTPTTLPVTELFYATMLFWLILLLVSPVITMRLFALEKYSGTFETLMTTPVSDIQVVLAKFFAALIFYLLTWLPLLGCMVLLARYTNDPSILDWGAVGTMFLGITLIGCLFMSIGCFASALTRSQIVAAMISLAVGASLFLLTFVGEKMSPQPGWINDSLNYISMVEHMQDFSRGIVDTRALAFYLTSTIFFLFLTYRVVQSRRWK